MINLFDESVRRQLRWEELQKIMVLLLGTLLLAWWFQNDYRLFIEPVHTPARILKVTDWAIDYEFYDSLADQTLTFRHELSPEQARRLRTHTALDVVYAASNSDVVVVPSLKRQLPVWVFAALHLLCFVALLRSIRDWWRLRPTQ
ncbi:hypothetical protein SAMN02745146_1674 [Hymenobacter daecheongensis DSM 21074]|uniref:Uncharacterized protein n=1 Tax=Hymenobacter daecheongensis DSM 21074 TaxID=1121955 RepID=A0A1M6EFC6_9BACT|nr:hypothetical protein [Hymenobacter daecheongensis]SHI84186.1 hypothetical protein SAMN02745146_1674 [Hymenobacter daecheongensis DSM 21074]